MGCSPEQPFLLIRAKDKSDTVDLALGVKQGWGTFGFRICENVSCISFFADPAAVHNYNARTDLSDDVNVMSDKKECGAALPVDVRHEF